MRKAPYKAQAPVLSGRRNVSLGVQQSLKKVSEVKNVAFRRLHKIGQNAKQPL